MKNLSEMQDLHEFWAKKNFPETTWEDALMGVVEEVGELHHHLLKQRQGIRGTYDYHEEGAKDSVADIVIYLMHVCTKRGWNFQEVVEETLDKNVLKRDWVKDKLLGGTKSEAIQREKDMDRERLKDVIQGNP